MFKKGPIPPFVHGLLDYGLAALLIAAPFLFAFDDEGTATAVSIVAGVLVLIIGASTDWTTGIIRTIPPAAHAMLDYALALLLIASPFLFGFSEHDTALAFFLVLGVVGLLLALATRFTPEDRSRRGRAPATPPA